MNFLALLGWHFDSERELFTLSELIGLFSLERVNPAPAVFDAKKLEWMNGVYLRALPTFDLAERLTAYLADRGSPLASQPDRDRRGHAARAGEDRDAGGVRAALLVPLRSDRDRAGGVGQGRRARARGRDPGRRAGRARGLRLDQRGRRGDAARRLRRARPQAARRLRARARGDHRARASRRACSRACTCSAATRRSRASAPPPRDSPTPRAARRRRRGRGRRPRTRVRRATPSRRVSAPATSASAGVRARAPGRDASVPSASCAARPAAGLSGATARAMSERVRPQRRPAA